MNTETLPQGKALLTDLCVLEITGSERLSFLHGQFTNHVARINDTFMSAAWCTPQGRMLCNMRLINDTDRILMIISADIAQKIMTRLRMFVLRADVKIRLAQELTVAGLIDTNAPALNLEQCVKEQDVWFARTSNWQNQRRYVAVGTAEALNAIDAPLIDQEAFKLGEILCGLARINAANQDKLIPQMINMDRLNGLVFDKGCYPGQEVIARMQNIGKCPRRTALFKAPLGTVLTEGADVFVDDQIDAIVVNAATSPEAAYALICLPVKALDRECAVKVGQQTLTQVLTDLA